MQFIASCIFLKMILSGFLFCIIRESMFNDMLQVPILIYIALNKLKCMIQQHVLLLERKCAKNPLLYYTPLFHLEIDKKIKYASYLAKFGNHESIFCWLKSTQFVLSHTTISAWTISIKNKILYFKLIFFFCFVSNFRFS